MEKLIFVNSNIFLPKDHLSTQNVMQNIAGNSGNSYITYSVIKMIYGEFVDVNDIKNIWLTKYNKTTAEEINKSYDKVILILQDNLRINDSYYKHDIYEDAIKFFEKIKLPIVVFSLGSNSFGTKLNIKKLKKSLIKFLQIISHKTESFGVRGEYTQEILEKIGIKNATVTGCPSYFETGPNRKVIKSYHKNKKLLIGGFVSNRYVNDCESHLILQDEEKYIKLLMGSYIKDSDLEGCHYKSHDKEIVNLYLKKRIHFFVNMDQWKSFIKDKNFSFYIGTRVHGSIMAINSGIVPIVTNQDFRSKEMCDLFKIPNIDLGYEDDIFEIYQNIDVNKINKEYNKLFNKFSEWIELNGLKINKEFYKNSQEDKKLDNKHLNIYSSYSKRYDLLVSSVHEKTINNDIKKHQNIVFKIELKVIKILCCFVPTRKYRKTLRNEGIVKLNKFLGRFVASFVFNKEKRKNIRKYFIYISDVG